MARTQTQTATKPADAPATANALTLAPQHRQQLMQIKAGIEQRMPLIQHLLPQDFTKEKFISTVLTAMANSKDGKLFECEPMSLLKAAVEAAELGLSLNPHRKECDIIPRWSSKLNRLEAQLQPRFGGLMTLAKRSGEIAKIWSDTVREGDIEFVWESGLNPVLRHKKKPNNKGPLIAAYCCWKLRDGTDQFEVVDQEDIARAKKASQSKSKDGEVFGPWKDDEEEMWRKTAIRRASKYMPSSTEDFQKAVQMDTMRDIGQEVELHDGEIMDITDVEPSGPTNAPQQQNRQMDNLEKRVAGGTAVKTPDKPAETRQEPPKQSVSAPDVTASTDQPQRQLSTIAPPKKDDKPDYLAWGDIVVPQIVQMTAEQKHEWRLRHTVFLEAAEFDCPDQIEAVVKALGPR